RDARVNLSRKQVRISGPRLDPETLIDALARAGHRAQELQDGLLAGQGDEMRNLLLRTGVAGFAMMNVMLLSVAVWSGAAETTEQMFHLISAAIALPAVGFAARPFFASAATALRAGRLNMDVPISLAILLAALVSLIGALQGADRHSWFDAALALTFFLLIGRTLDHAGRSAARS
ncbi:MAG TPA: ATPase, partial [Roseovarius nubinhibens]|nr:ATPase [Roseovarius nubinhibens]